MTPQRRQAIENSLNAGATPAEVKRVYTRIVKRKRSWRPSEKAVAIAEFERNVDEVAAEFAAKPRKRKAP